MPDFSEEVHVDVGVVAIAGGGLADRDQHTILVGAVDDDMAVAVALGEGAAVAGRERGFAVVVDQHRTP